MSHTVGWVARLAGVTVRRLDGALGRLAIRPGAAQESADFESV